MLMTLRIRSLLTTDPLSCPDWDGKFAPTEIDYLANNGAALSRAIDEDSVAAEGIRKAIEAFKDNGL